MQIFACFSLIYQQKSLKIGKNVYLDQLNQSYYYSFLIRPLLHAKTSKYMAEKAATRVNFRRFSLVSLSFINRSPWELVKMCILISLTNHIPTTFWLDHFLHTKTSKYMAEKAETRVNFRRFLLVSLSFINRSPWKLVKMCILISLTNHISTTFWSDQFHIPKQANIW